MTYTQRRVLIEELSELLDTLHKADDLAKDYFWDAWEVHPNEKDEIISDCLYPQIDIIISAVDKRLQALRAMDSLPV